MKSRKSEDDDSTNMLTGGRGERNGIHYDIDIDHLPLTPENWFEIKEWLDCLDDWKKRWN